LEKSDQENLEISSGIHSVVGVFTFSSDRESNSDRAVNEEKIVFIVPSDVLEGWDEFSILTDNGQRTDFKIISCTIRASRTTLKPKDKRSRIIVGGCLGVTSSGIEDVEDLGKSTSVGSDVPIINLSGIGDVGLSLVDNIGFRVIEIRVVRV
jgi:hypothetical protein